jgi:hypothetical protein
MPVHRDSELDHMAGHFFGNGRWDAPFWLIRPEAGMGNVGDFRWNLLIDTESKRLASRIFP